MDNKFYVYKWFIKDTKEVFYIGKGTRNRKDNVSRRNLIFKEYYNNNICENEIIQYFDNEQQALNFEKETIDYYKSIGQAKANIDRGGHGGLAFIWNEEMRQYKSKYNPMKNIDQRKRMKENNPMHNPKVIAKAKMRGKPVIINGEYFINCKTAAKELHVNPSTIGVWCKRGYSFTRKPCRFANEDQKVIPEMKKTSALINNIKAVIIDNIYYPSVKLGAKAINVWPESIIRAIKEQRLCKGHTCSYANQQPSQENNQNSILDGSETRE